jgi:hypothetical protein
MTSIEDLRGKEFVHYKDEFIIYIVGRGRDGRTVIHWKGKADTTVYRDEQVVDFFERNIWISL